MTCSFSLTADHCPDFLRLSPRGNLFLTPLPPSPAAAAKSLHSCLTLCNPMGCSLSIRLLRPWGFSRQEYWSGLPCPPPGFLPSPGIEPRSPALQADSLPLRHQGSPPAPYRFQIEISNLENPKYCQGPAWFV